MAWVAVNKPTKWIVLDDKDYMCGERDIEPNMDMQGHFVKVNPYKAFTSENAKFAEMLMEAQPSRTLAQSCD